MFDSVVAYGLFLSCFVLLSVGWVSISDAPAMERSVRAFFVRLGMVMCLVILFTGVTQPIGAVVTGSMAPAVQPGDVVISSTTTNPNPLVDTTIYPAANPDAPQVFGQAGSVIVYQTYLDRHVVHRVRYQVETGENWVETVDQEHVPAGIDCSDVSTCPAPTDGYITRGDANKYYDQLGEIQIVSKRDIRGIAKLRVPELGYAAKIAYDRSQETTRERQPTTEPPA